MPAAGSRPAHKPLIRAQRSPARMLPLLIAACLALGAILSWGLSQKRERARLIVRNHDLDQAYTVIISQRDDLAHLLADPRTRMIQLSGHAAAANRFATIAWNAERRTGFVLAEQMPLLPPGQVYRVWYTNSANDTSWPTDRSFQPDVGLTCVEFHLPISTASTESNAGASQRFVITATPLSQPLALVADAVTSRLREQIAYESDPPRSPRIESPSSR